MNQREIVAKQRENFERELARTKNNLFLKFMSETLYKERIKQLNSVIDCCLLKEKALENN